MVRGPDCKDWNNAWARLDLRLVRLHAITVELFLDTTPGMLNRGRFMTVEVQLIIVAGMTVCILLGGAMLRLAVSLANKVLDWTGGVPKPPADVSANIESDVSSTAVVPSTTSMAYSHPEIVEPSYVRACVIVLTQTVAVYGLKNMANGINVAIAGLLIVIVVNDITFRMLSTTFLRGALVVFFQFGLKATVAAVSIGISYAFYGRL